jgi:hypothetical protein
MSPEPAVLTRRRQSTIADAMVTRPDVHPPWTTVGELRAFFEDEHVHMALLVEGGVLVGTVERCDLASETPDDAPAAEIAALDGRTIAPDVLLSSISPGSRRRLAVTTADGELVGLLCLKAGGDGFCSDADVAARRREAASSTTRGGRRGLGPPRSLPRVRTR